MRRLWPARPSLQSQLERSFDQGFAAGIAQERARWVGEWRAVFHDDPTMVVDGDEVLRHLVKTGVIAMAERLMAEDAAGVERESITPEEFRALLAQTDRQRREQEMAAERFVVANPPPGYEGAFERTLDGYTFTLAPTRDEPEQEPDPAIGPARLPHRCTVFRNGVCLTCGAPK